MPLPVSCDVIYEFQHPVQDVPRFPSGLSSGNDGSHRGQSSKIDAFT